MKLTKTLIESLENKQKRYAVFDDLVTGFSVRVGASGDKAFFFVYRAGKGRDAVKRWLRIGTYPTLTVEQAREIAKAHAAAVAFGGDPAEDVSSDKKALTVATAIEDFFKAHIEAKRKPSTARSYRVIATVHIVPHLGNKKIEKVSHRHIAALHHSLRDRPYQANRCAALLSVFFGWCEKQGLRERGTNPVAGLEKYKEHKRTVFMASQEVEALGNGFATLESELAPRVSAALKLLILTGARKNEILALKWEHIDFSRGIARLPDSKTGAKTIHLPAPAIALLQSLPQEAPYCFPSEESKTGHIVNVENGWRRLLATAGLEGWRIHDLRHAFASYAASGGRSLPVIGALLGHSQAQTTARYAHLTANPVAEAAEETAAAIMTDFSGGGKIVSLKRGAK